MRPLPIAVVRRKLRPVNITILLPFIVLIGAMFLMTRSAKRKQQQAAAMRNELQPGSGVRTIGGIYATVKEINEDTVLLDTGAGVEEDRVLVDLLHRRVNPPDRADAAAGLQLVAHRGGLLLLALGRAGHEEHGPDEHDEGEENGDIHGTEFPSHDRDGERPHGWGYVYRRLRRHRRSLSESTRMEQRSAWHLGS